MPTDATKTISELTGMSFLIPSYQRGYRWTAQQVTDLLSDIQEFIDKNQHGFYCIQPLVLKNNGNVWEVIDGQQRLTMIYILLSYLDKPIYSIEYETRKNDTDKSKDSKDFLEGIKNKTETDSSGNIDFHFMFVAYQTIKNWFEEPHANVDKTKFLRTLLRKVDFIWYESTDEDQIKVFTRLNIGKISLTNAELIKAMFLNKSNFRESGDYQKIRLQQQEIASEWDKIEYTLQDDDFWLFLYKPGYSKPTRIDFILDMLREENVLNLTNEQCSQLGTDEHQTFRYFYFGFKNNSDKMLEYWKEVKTLFQTFQEWFNDLELYHYVGYLLTEVNGQRVSKIDISFLTEKWRDAKSKNTFVNTVKEEIIRIVHKKQLCQQYETSGSPKTQCRPILLLHNIQTIINQNRTFSESTKYKLPVFYKFPFHLFKKEKWDVEHIDSHTENDLADENEQREWLRQSLLLLGETNELKHEIQAFLEPKEGVEKPSFEDLRVKIGLASADVKLNEEEKNKLWNFCLLDPTTNRGYGNALFPIKRRIVIAKSQGKTVIVGDDLSVEEKNGAIAFIPPCSEKVFQKAFNPLPTGLREWNKADAKSYLKNIAMTLRDFLFSCDDAELQKTLKEIEGL